MGMLRHCRSDGSFVVCQVRAFVRRKRLVPTTHTSSESALGITSLLVLGCRFDLHEGSGMFISIELKPNLSFF